MEKFAFCDLTKIHAPTVFKEEWTSHITRNKVRSPWDLKRGPVQFGSRHLPMRVPEPLLNWIAGRQVVMPVRASIINSMFSDWVDTILWRKHAERAKTVYIPSPWISTLGCTWHLQSGRYTLPYIHWDKLLLPFLCRKPGNFRRRWLVFANNIACSWRAMG